MNFKTTIVLLLALIAAGVFLLVEKYRDNPSQEASQENVEGGKKLYTLDAADVDSIDLTPGPDLHRPAVSLVKRGADWEMTSPVAAKADNFKVDGLLQKIFDLRASAMLDGSEAASKGLAPARMTVSFTAKSKTYHLSVGDRAAMGDMMYVQPEGDKKIDVVAADAYDDLLQPADSFRDTQLITASPADIQHVEIDRPEGKIALDRVSGKGGQHWEITSPRNLRADENRMTDLLGAITGLHAQSWVKSGSVEAKIADIKQPQLTVRFSSAAPAEELPTTKPATSPSAAATKPAEVVTIRFGRYEDIRHENVYASVSTSPYLVKVSAIPLKTFEQSVLDLRDRDVLDIDPQEVSRLTLDVQTPGAPTTKSAHASDDRTIIVVRAPSAAEVPPLIAAPGYRPDSATAQAAARKMEKFNLQRGQPPQWLIASHPPGIVSAARVNALLDTLHPLRVDQYLAKNPVTQPLAEQGVYVLHVTAQAAGGAAPRAYDLRLIDRGPDQAAVGEYNDLTFEVPHSVVNNLEGDFTQAPKKETPPNAPEEGLPGRP